MDSNIISWIWEIIFYIMKALFEYIYSFIQKYWVSSGCQPLWRKMKYKYK